MLRSDKSWFHWTPWAYVLVCAPPALLLVELLRGALHETQMTRTLTLRSEMQGAGAQAMWYARGLEVLLEAHGGGDMPWEELRKQPWLTDYWSAIPVGPRQLYVAVVDEAGNIVAHTDASRSGERLARGWYERRVGEAGPNVVWAPSSPLAGERPSYDVTVPLSAGGRSIGEYHAGLDGQWLDSEIAIKQQAVLARWVPVFVVMGTVVAAAVGGLVFLARRQGQLGRMVRRESQQRARTIAQLGSGLAHEIRNPLHALRINLHTLRRALGGHSSLSEDQLIVTIQESNGAIDRLDELMRDLLQFSDPTAGNVANVDVVHELRATLNLLAEDLRREQIETRAQLPPEPTPVGIDPVRLRQALLNLLTFAEHRAGKSGAIDVAVTRRDGGVEITVGDSGPDLPESQRDRLFEPFQAPVETGSGLGLALVRVYVEEAGGRASCDGGATDRSLCRVWLPLRLSEPKGGL
jgi:two-component system, NtrC family, sensor histidine kinase HydH